MTSSVWEDRHLFWLMQTTLTLLDSTATILIFGIHGCLHWAATRTLSPVLPGVFQLLKECPLFYQEIINDTECLRAGSTADRLQGRELYAWGLQGVLLRANIYEGVKEALGKGKNETVMQVKDRPQTIVYEALELFRVVPPWGKRHGTLLPPALHH